MKIHNINITDLAQGWMQKNHDDFSVLIEMPDLLYESEAYNESIERISKALEYACCVDDGEYFITDIIVYTFNKNEELAFRTFWNFLNIKDNPPFATAWKNGELAGDNT